MASGEFALTPEMVVQGLIGLLLLLWAAKDALPLYKSMKNAAHTASATSTTNAMVAAVSMAWDRDQQERLLQIMERIAAANELQARNQTTMADQQRNDMTERMNDLLKALERKEDQLSAMISRRR